MLDEGACCRDRVGNGGDDSTAVAASKSGTDVGLLSFGAFGVVGDSTVSFT